jgi:hypothetical protein
MKIICPYCKCNCFDTTDKYKPDVISHGAMFKVTDHYATWDVFPQNEDQTFGTLECPECGNLMHNGDGIVRIEGYSTNADHVQTILDAPVKIGAKEDSKAEDIKTETEEIEGSLPEGKVHCPICNGIFFENRIHIHIKAKHPEVAEGK